MDYIDDNPKRFFVKLFSSIISAVGMVLVINAILSLLPEGLILFLKFIIGFVFILVGALIAVVGKGK